jgi:hypothetical protein
MVPGAADETMIAAARIAVLEPDPADTLWQQLPDGLKSDESYKDILYFCLVYRAPWIHMRGNAYPDTPEDSSSTATSFFDALNKGE